MRCPCICVTTSRDPILAGVKTDCLAHDKFCSGVFLSQILFFFSITIFPRVNLSIKIFSDFLRWFKASCSVNTGSWVRFWFSQNKLQILISDNKGTCRPVWLCFYTVTERGKNTIQNYRFVEQEHCTFIKHWKKVLTHHSKRACGPYRHWNTATDVKSLCDQVNKDFLLSLENQLPVQWDISNKRKAPPIALSGFLFSVSTNLCLQQLLCQYAFTPVL